MPERSGSTVSSTLELQAGSNAVLAVSSPTGLTPTQTLGLLANSLAAGIGSPAEHIGSRLGYEYYAIGEARPVALRQIDGSTPTLASWYSEMGAPVGPLPVFYTINADWRGAARTITWPADIFVVPPKAKVVRGAANYQDGTPAELRARFASEATDEWVAKTGAAGGEFADKLVSSVKDPMFLISVASLVVGGAMLVLNLRRK